MKIAVGSDHAGLPAKKQVVETLRLAGHEVLDLGTHTEDSVDYPDYALAVAKHILTGEAELGVLCCGTGLGMSMTANRHRGVRAALVYDEETARLAREHNDANVLALGGRFLDPDRAERILEIWLQTPFQGGRHDRRIRKIDSPQG